MRTLWLDMDGTIANLYGVNGWLNDLINHNVRPYAEAKVMWNMSTLARLLNKLQHNGYNIGIISWLSKNSTIEYDTKVTEAKNKWLQKHLKSVTFNYIHIVEYGTPKSNFARPNDILFDDEEKNRQDFIGTAYDAMQLFTVLKQLASAL